MANELTVLAWKLRQHVTDIVMAGGGGHIGGDMSVLNILVELYFDKCIYPPGQRTTPTGICSL